MHNSIDILVFKYYNINIERPKTKTWRMIIMTQEERMLRFAEKAKRGMEFLNNSGNLPELTGSDKQVA